MFVTIINGQNKTIVSVVNSNYWIYNNESYSGYDGSRSYTLIKNEIIGDTIINHISCKKVEVITYKDNQKNVKYEYWYSDEIVFSKYNGSTFSNYYDTRIKKDSIIYSGYVPTQGQVSSSITVDSEYIFNGYYKTQSFNSSSSSRGGGSSVYAEKFGFIHSSGHYVWDHYSTYLTNAKIENVYYGKLPPLLINNYSINGKILDIDFEVLGDNQNYDKLLIYKYSPDEYRYKVVDSLYTSKLHLHKAMVAGNYDLKFSYRNSSGVESVLSNNIKFSVVPDAFILYQNYPNPFNGRTKIPYETIYTTEIELAIVNILGEQIYTKTISNEKQGYYEFDVDLSGFSSGIYLYQISTKFGRALTNKMILLK